jgi:uncharacterized membrane protein
MPPSRTAAQRRRAKAMAHQTTYAKVAVTEPDDVDEIEDWEDPPYYPQPRWPAIAGLILCVAGLGPASYLTYAHYTTAAVLACPDKGYINCGLVTTSVYSHILGLPVAVLGLVYFVGMIPLLLPVAWRSRSPLIRYGRLAASIIGVGTILWLVYAEIFKLDAICIYCTSVHVLTFLLFVVVALGTVATAADQAG